MPPLIAILLFAAAIFVPGYVAEDLGIQWHRWLPDWSLLPLFYIASCLWFVLVGTALYFML